MTNKRCPMCGETKSDDQFYTIARRGGQLSAYCKQCCSIRGKNQRASMKGNGKEYELKSNYNMTLQQYEDLLEEQGGSCAVCGGVNADGRSLSVDHDHTCCPGKKSCGKCVRGLLCLTCNVGLGHFEDDVNRLRSAIEYLQAN